MQRGQLVCGTRHDMHRMCGRHIVSCRLNSIDGVRALRCGSVRRVGRRVCGMRIRLLFRNKCGKLYFMRGGYICDTS